MPRLSGHTAVYYNNKYYLFYGDVMYVYDFLTNEIKDMTRKVNGKLLDKYYTGTSTLVRDKIYNIGDEGVEVFYPD